MYVWIIRCIYMDGCIFRINFLRAISVPFSPFLIAIPFYFSCHFYSYRYFNMSYLLKFLLKLFFSLLYFYSILFFLLKITKSEKKEFHVRCVYVYGCLLWRMVECLGLCREFIVQLLSLCWCWCRFRCRCVWVWDILSEIQ